MQLKHFLLLAGLFSTSVLAGKIYTWTDKNGTVHYSSSPKIDANAKQFDVAATNVIKAEPIASKTAVSKTKQNQLADSEYSSQDVANMMSGDLCQSAKRKLKFSTQMISSGQYEWKGNKFKKEDVKRAQQSAKQQIKDFC